jgi:hypothetical protein
MEGRTQRILYHGVDMIRYEVQPDYLKEKLAVTL